MEKVLILKGLDCPNCAAKIQREVAAIQGVETAYINLINQTLTIQGDAACWESTEKQVRTIVHRYEPEVEVLESAPQASQKRSDSKNVNRNILLRLIAGSILFAAGILVGSVHTTHLAIELAFYILSYLILGSDIFLRATKNIAKGQIFDENFLMILASLGAFLIGEHPEAVAVILFYQVGEFFQDLSVQRSRKSIAELMDIRPDSATVYRHGEAFTLSPDAVAIGEHIVVRPGEKIPLDGIVIDGESLLDTTALTGESVPRTARIGDSVLSGCINQSGILTIEVTKSFGESTASKILALVENAAARKAPTENFITTFARYYTPAVVLLAAVLSCVPPLLLGGGWIDWIRRGMVFLVISCPCALVLSIPLTFFGGIGAASKHGILVKGSNYLEALTHVRTVVFDKTGTLTEGIFQVSQILCAEGFRPEQVLEYAAQAESLSNHPIARSILTAYGSTPNPASVSHHKEIPGQGISITWEGKHIHTGNAKLMESEGIVFPICNMAGTKVYVAVDGQYAGCIIIADKVKADSKQAISDLKRMGVEKTIMLTGDEEAISQVIAEELNLDQYYAQLLPHEKVEKLELLDREKRPGSKLVFVGDGINDAPVLARADVGIAMGALGSDAAIEAADVVLMTDEPAKLVEAIAVAKATRRIVIQNIIISLGIKCGFLLLGALGITGMWEAVFADVGVALIAVLNAMRILKK